MDEQQPSLSNTNDQYEYEVAPIGWTLKTTWSVMSNNWLSVLGLALLPLIPIFIAGIAIAGLVLGANLDGNSSEVSDNAAAGLFVGGSITFILLALILVYMYIRIFAGLVGKGINYMDNGVKFKTMEVWEAGKKRAFTALKTVLRIAWPILVVYFLTPVVFIVAVVSYDDTANSDNTIDIAEYFGTFFTVAALAYLFVVGYGYYVFTRYGIAAQISIYENLGPKESMAKSKEVTNANRSIMFGMFFAVLGVSIVFSILSNIPVVGIVPSFMMGMLGLVFPVVLYQLFLKRKATTADPTKTSKDVPSLSDTV